LNKPFFNENDIQTFFDSEQSKKTKIDGNQEAIVEIEFEPEIGAQKTLPEVRPSPPNPNHKPEYQPLYPVQNRPNTQSSTPLQSKPYVVPVPPPGALPKVESSYTNRFEDRSRPSAFSTIMKFLGVFAIIFIVSFILLNGPALLKIIKYHYVTQINHKSFATTTPITNPDANQSKLIIPEIQVNAPIIWNVDAADVTKNLEKGVVHYRGTALPGKAGNIFITGHSSYYSWAQGGYKDVFALLDRLKVGDKIYLQYKGDNLVYEVSGTKVVSPNDLSSLEPTTNRTLTLMTCVPVGTNLRRLVVTANQVL